MGRILTEPLWNKPSYKARVKNEGQINIYDIDDSIDAELLHDFATVRIIIKPKGTGVKRFVHNNSTFSAEVVVGINTEEMHHGFLGATKDIPYGDLLAGLNFYGFDPLAPLRDSSDVAKRFKSMFINDLLVPMVNSSKYISTTSINPWLRKKGELFRDLARDYVRGSYSGINKDFSDEPKPDLSDKTIEIREYKEGKGITYSGGRGINEALYETGQLEDAIRVIDTKVYGKLGRFVKSKRSNKRAKGLGKTQRTQYITAEEAMRRRIERSGGRATLLQEAAARAAGSSGIFTFKGLYGVVLYYIPAKISKRRLEENRFKYSHAAEINMEALKNIIAEYKANNSGATNDDVFAMLKSKKEFHRERNAIKRAADLIRFMRGENPNS